MGLKKLAAKPPESVGAVPNLSREEYEALRVRWANENTDSLKGEQGEHCPICKNRGYTAELNNGAMVYRECICETKRRSLRRLKRSGLIDQLDKCTFDAFQTLEAWQKAAKQKALDYLRNPNGRWFVAAGSVGAGKTHLCTAICGALLQAGLEVRYMRWQDDGGRIKAAVNDTPEYNRLVNPLKTVRVLYIDDFWKSNRGNPSNGDINLAFEILNARYVNPRLITIVSSELRPSQMLAIDEAVGSRIYERSKSSALELVGDKNWRTRA